MLPCISLDSFAGTFEETFPDPTLIPAPFRTSPSVIPSFADGSALAAYKAEKRPALYRARSICYCGKASAVSQALDVCNQQAHCSRPKPGNANWALAAAGWPPLHSSTPPVFTASLLLSKSRIIRHRAPSHTGTLDRSNTCLRSLTSRMGRPPPPFRTTSPCPPAFDTCKRAQRTRRHI